MNNVNKNIHKLINVYQEKYKNGKCSGLGDFIRGSYFLMQFCGKFNIEYEVSFYNHLIGKYLKNVDTTKYTGISDINIMRDNRDNNFIECIDTTTKEISYKTHSENYIIGSVLNYMHNIPNQIKYINNICFPLYSELEASHKAYMKHILEPNDMIKQYVQSSLNIMDVSRGEYTVIHIRCGDNVLINKASDTALFEKSYGKLKELPDISSEKYLIISDSNELKVLLKGRFPQFKIHTENIVVHIGEGTKNTEESIKSLLLDFYFMSYSKNIISYSTYTHGSGLSLWCAKTFDIPYKCYYLL